MRKHVWEIGSLAVLGLVLLVMGGRASIHYRQQRTREALRTRLNFHAAQGDVREVQALLRQGVSPRDLNPEGQTALHHAVHWSRTQVAATLLEAGADPNLCGPNAAPPVFQVLEAWEADKTVPLLRLLLDYGADPNGRDPAPYSVMIGGLPLRPRDQTVLMRSIIQRKDNLVSVLLERDADVNARDSDKRTPLIWWVLIHHYDPRATRLGQLLLRKGADVRARDEQGKTALDYARKWKDEAMMRLLTSPPQSP